MRINWDDPQARELADRIVDAACEASRVLENMPMFGATYDDPFDDLARSILDAQAVGVLKR